MKPLRSLWMRKTINTGVTVISTLAALLGILILAWILYVVLQRGYEAINWSFFTELPAPPGMEGGGLANAILGTMLITAFATVLGIPLGLMAGVYLAEFGKQQPLANLIRFTVNVMMGVPSIIVGLFVFTLIVMPMQHFSGYAGALALAIIMLPVVARTTEDMLTMVPNSLRESALALGAPRWRTTLGIVFRGAKKGLTTGILLSVARVSGETAPLLFTALNSPYWPSKLNEPTPNLTVTIFNYAMSPYEDWQRAAWGASLLIMTAVLSLSVLARYFMKDAKR